MKASWRKLLGALYVSQDESHELELGEAQCTLGSGSLKNTQMHTQAEPPPGPLLFLSDLG